MALQIQVRQAHLTLSGVSSAEEAASVKSPVGSEATTQQPARQIFVANSHARENIFTAVSWTVGVVALLAVAFIITRIAAPPNLRDFSARVIDSLTASQDSSADNAAEERGLSPPDEPVVNSRDDLGDDLGDVGQPDSPLLADPQLRSSLPIPSFRISKAGFLTEETVSALFGRLGSFLPGHIPKPVVAELVQAGPREIYSLEQNINDIDIVIPAWIGFDATGQTVVTSIDERRRLRTALRSAHDRPLLIPAMHNLGNNGPQARLVHRLLRSTQEEQRQFSRDIALLFKQIGADGIAIDFLGLEIDDVALLGTLVGTLKSTLSADGLIVIVRAPLHDYDEVWKQATAAADYVILYDRDYNWDDAELSLVDRSREFLESLEIWREVRAEADLIVEVAGPSYEVSGQQTNPHVISFDDAIDRLATAPEGVRIDHHGPGLGYFATVDGEGKALATFVQDAATVRNTLQLMNESGSEGIALRHLGSEDAAVWTILRDYKTGHYAGSSPSTELNYNYPFTTAGKGEVMFVTGATKPGSRRFITDEEGRIVGEEFLSFPQRQVLKRWGATDKRKIVLTFDDGPDGVYTARILDILKAYDAPATFFTVGKNVLNYPQLVRRMVLEGHEVGNHTFSHPNLSLVTNLQMHVELSATQRVLQSVTGRGSVLFRSPYASDISPDGFAEAKIFAKASEYGYLSVGMAIDPVDWLAKDSDKIVTSVLAAVDKNLGHIVLLHDAGGDRTPTVQALPKLITALRARGYEFVTVSELLDLPLGALESSVSSGASDVLQSLSLGLYGTAVKWGAFLLLAAIVLSIARLGVIMLLAGVPRRREFPEPDLERLPLVTVIVPGYNEERVICATVESILLSDYRNLEVLVVDDGSTDATLGRLRAKKFASNVRILEKPNGGKASALNLGIRQSLGEIVVCVDADTHFCKATISKLARHFADPKVGAVAGNAKVGNRINLLTRLQALEYITAQNLDRRAFEILGGITVVPGAVGAWRRAALQSVGGYSTDTLAEDADLTISLARHGWKVLYEPDAIALTEAPGSVGALARQRFRWSYGTLQTLWKHKGVFLEPKSRGLCFAGFPHMFLYQFFLPFLAPIADLVFLLALGGVLLSSWFDPGSRFVSEGTVLLQSYFLFLLIDAAAAGAALIGEKKEPMHLLVVVPLQRLFYRQILYYVLIKAVVAAIKGRLARWDKLERRATVAASTGGN